MLRFYQGTTDPFYFLLLKYIQSPNSSSTKQEIIFSVDSSITIPNMSNFCIPQVNFDPSSEGEVRFIFYLKSNDLYPTYGYVVQLIRNQKRTVYCLLSPYYSPQKLFSIITQYLMKNPQEQISYLSRNIKLNFNSPQNIFFNEKELVLKGVGQLISLLDPELIGYLIVCLVVDYHIIVTSSNFEILSLFVFSILSTIHPLIWPGVFIPVLSESMIDTILAPFPYIIGMHNSIAGRAQEPEVEPHILINVDEKTMTFYPDMIQIPTKVIKLIDYFKKKVSQLSSDRYHLFSQYSHELIIGCIGFALGKQTDNPKKLYKHWNILKGCHNLEPFPQMVCQSQLVLNLMREIENKSESIVYKAYFEEEQSDKLLDFLPSKFDKKTKNSRAKNEINYQQNNSNTLLFDNNKPEALAPSNAKARQTASTNLQSIESKSSTSNFYVASKSYSSPLLNTGSKSQTQNFDCITQIETLAALFASKYENGGCIDNRLKKKDFKTNAGIERPENLSFSSKLDLYNHGYNADDNDNDDTSKSKQEAKDFPKVLKNKKPPLFPHPPKK